MKLDLHPSIAHLRTYLLGLPRGGWSTSDVPVAREVLRLTQDELARATGYARSGIARLEGSDSLPLAFELALRYLLEEDALLPPCREHRIGDLNRFDDGDQPDLVCLRCGAGGTYAEIVEEGAGLLPGYVTAGGLKRLWGKVVAAGRTGDRA